MATDDGFDKYETWYWGDPCLFIEDVRMAALCMKHEWVNAGFTSIKEVCKHCDIPREEWEAKKAAAFNPAGRPSTPSTDSKPVFKPVSSMIHRQEIKPDPKRVEETKRLQKKINAALDAGQMHILVNPGEFEALSTSEIESISRDECMKRAAVLREGVRYRIYQEEIGDWNDGKNQKSQGTGQAKADRDADRD